MNLRKSFLDNPVLIKHIRSRLRRQHLMPPLIMALVIASTICWGSLALESGRRLTGLAFLLIVQSGILFVGGSSQVGLAVAQARTAGILDFHRISPQHPFSLAVGFILGGPILEWVLFAAMTPFALVLGLVSRGEPLGLLAIYLDTVVVALLYHTISMAAGLVGRAPNRQNYLGVLFLLMVLYSFLGRWMSTAGSPGFLTTIPVVSTALSDLNREALLFGIPVPVLLHSLLHQLFLLGVALLAATRKMRQEQAPFLSKRQALGAFVGVALLAASSLIETIRQQPAPTLPESRNGGLAYFHFLLWLAATVLLLLVTPGSREVLGGLIRARRQGLAVLPLWDDRATNTGITILFCSLLAAASTLAILLGGFPATAFLGTGAAVCTLLYTTSARQAIELQWPRTAASYFWLFLFLAWMGPLLVAAVLSLGSGFDETPTAVLSVSPLVGIWTATVLGDKMVAGGVLAAATSLLLAIGLSQFRFQVERRTRRQALEVGA